MVDSYQVYVPITGFRYFGKSVEIAPGINISEMPNPSFFDKFKNMVSKDEWEDIINAKYCLDFDCSDINENIASETMNLILLSIWLVKPNRVQAKLQLKIGKGGFENRTTRNRILDRVQWIYDEENEDFTKNDILAVSVYYRSFANIYRVRGRLSNAIVLTLSGCWSIFWQSALISHAAAVETILTYSKKRGLTKRLAASYASLVEKDESKREDPYTLFCKLYSYRSDAVHGRIHDLEENERLQVLSSFQKLLRTLWQKVLVNESAVIELDKADSKRKDFLTSL